MGLPDSVSEERKARARQLKGYLMFFDQLLANQFAQLAHVKDLFSFHEGDAGTYFSQVVDDAGLSLDEIRGDLFTHRSNVKGMTEDAGGALARKNRFLNHLLARFAEQFTDYSLVLPQESEPALLVRKKQRFLHRYPRISSARGIAIDYLRPLDMNNLSGLEERIRLRLGLVEDEKFLLVEHILLCPIKGGNPQILPPRIPNWRQDPLMDPYSLQVSFVFRIASSPVKDETLYRRLIERTVREETPAHITPYIHWMDDVGWEDFQTAYRAWIAERRTYWATEYGVNV